MEMQNIEKKRVRNKPATIKGIVYEHRAGVIEQLKTLQRVQALSPDPEAVPVLMKENLTSAFQVGEPKAPKQKMLGTIKA